MTRHIEPKSAVEFSHMCMSVHYIVLLTGVDDETFS